MTGYQIVPVDVPSISPFLLRDVREGSRRPPAISLDARLYLPDATHRPVPAILLSHGLGGAKDHREHRYARMLAARGFAALVFDGFVSRGKQRFSDTIRALRVTESMLLADAFAGLDFLARREEVRADAISIAGFSYGGMITALTAYRQLAETFLPDGPRFAAHVSYYGCSVPRLDEATTTGAPVLMMLGALDRNTNIPRTKAIAADMRRGGSPVDVEIFADTYHQWDGNDAERRFVSFNLHQCHFRIDENNGVRDERTGIRMRGRASRTAMIGLSASRNGYHILRNEAALERSDAMLLAALARSTQRAGARSSGNGIDGRTLSAALPTRHGASSSVSSQVPRESSARGRDAMAGIRRA
jgi:dienelactone hydrolase